MDSFHLVLAGIPILVGLLIIGLVLAVNIKAKNAARKWAKVEGEILSADVELQRGRASGGVAAQYFKPVVKYAYQVGGQSYAGERLDFAARAYSIEEKAQKRLAPYQASAKVSVHYDPTNPAKCVLEPIAAGNALMIVLGIAFILVGILFVI